MKALGVGGLLMAGAAAAVALWGARPEGAGARSEVAGARPGAPVTVAAAAQRQRWGFDFEPPEVEYYNAPYDDLFTFVRVRFRPSQWAPGPYQWGLDLKWNHDYPRADVHLPQILGEVTGMRANGVATTIVSVGDPELFRYPWVYMCEVGYLTLDDDEVRNLRDYLLKGGFMVVDDFVNYHWFNLESEMKKVFPELDFKELGRDHPIFNTFFEIKDLTFAGGPYNGFDGGRSPRYFALFENNDPNGRMLMIANFDNDIGESWEFPDNPYVLVDITNDAFKLGVNYVIYSTLH